MGLLVGYSYEYEYSYASRKRVTWCYTGTRTVWYSYSYESSRQTERIIRRVPPSPGGRNNATGPDRTNSEQRLCRICQSIALDTVVSFFKTRPALLIDDLPPFDITHLFASEETSRDSSPETGGVNESERIVSQ